MKHLLPLLLVLIITVITLSLINSNECIEIGNASIASISFGTCDLSHPQSTLSPLLALFWLAMSVCFAITLPKSTVANKYKIALFIFGLPLTVFVYLIAYISENIRQATQSFK
ncbi:transcriptional regulator [Pseudoalteromonas sp. MMG010]|uniref:transcriptional regulator n=1 Tax=Pseudoalteromonas sp. MMG010 TaxID=2822685 RepID=UPI001B3A1A21|nr:transcriptional regulator [Pseudoalteromonas sp. MMG010]MBQ4833541.1 transcriptional regulator [Pseudoalteromonas sp. MMG010]